MVSVIHDFEPDIEAFYKEWWNLPVPERADWSVEADGARTSPRPVFRCAPQENESGIE